MSDTVAQIDREQKAKKRSYDIGMIGLGVMGRNLILNMADHGFAVAGYDKDKSKLEALRDEAESRNVQAAEDVAGLVKILKRPRTVMMLVPAGRPVDAVIRDTMGHLETGDLIVDGGNSHFADTDLRMKMLADKGINYLGVGISGGEHGARHGPSMMPGGSKEAYERVKPIFEAAAAHVGDDPCVTYLGPRSAGHYVKMVHNGIEYGLMQLIAETYDLMKRGLKMTDDDLHEVYTQWNDNELGGYLIEITGRIFLREEEGTGKRLIDVILDEAQQKGTGMWTSQSAMELRTPVPTIDTAVAMRDLSCLKDQRKTAGELYDGPHRIINADRETLMDQLRAAFYASMIMTYAQGFALLRGASQSHGYDLRLRDVARIWRGGCIIRAALLEEIRSIYQARPDLENLLLGTQLGQEVAARRADLRDVVCVAAELGIPAPGFMASLAYFDAYRSEWLPANLIEAQRDFFGAHTYERIDAKGIFHTQWEQP